MVSGMLDTLSGGAAELELRVFRSGFLLTARSGCLFARRQSIVQTEQRVPICSKDGHRHPAKICFVHWHSDVRFLACNYSTCESHESTQCFLSFLGAWQQPPSRGPRLKRSLSWTQRDRTYGWCTWHAPRTQVGEGAGFLFAAGCFARQMSHGRFGK